MDTGITLNQYQNRLAEGHRLNEESTRSIVDELFPEMVVLQVPSNGKGHLPTNLIESWSSYFLQLMVPAIDVDSLRIQVVARHLTVSGKYSIPVIESGSFVRRQLPTGSFAETFELPEEINADKTVARYDRGVLTIELPKVAYLRPATVAVEVVG